MCIVADLSKTRIIILFRNTVIKYYFLYICCDSNSAIIKFFPFQSMFKSFKMTMLSACAVAGLALYSCSKQNDPGATTGVTAATQKTDLVGVMAADALVRDYISDNEVFIGEYTTWFKGLTTEQRNAYKASCATSTAKGQRLPDPSHSVAEVKAYVDLQSARIEQIKLKYPAFAKLGSDKFESALMMAGSAIAQSNGATAGRALGCGDQYNACMGAGKNSADACWAALVSCVNTTYP